jgi:hypothetical protein
MGLGIGSRNEEHCRSAIVQAARVPRRNTAARLKRWLQSRQLCKRGVAPWPLIGGDHSVAFSTAHRYRNEFPVKAACIYRGNGLLVAAKGEPILHLAADLVGARHLICTLRNAD